MADVYVYAPAREQGEADMFVGMNGKGYRVPRGRTVKLPAEVAGALVNGYPEAMIITEGVVGTGLDSLSDVDIATPTNGQTLVYDSTSAKWENGAGGGGGGDLVMKVELEMNETGAAITSHTWQQIFDALLAGKIVVGINGGSTQTRGGAAMYLCDFAEFSTEDHGEFQDNYWRVKIINSSNGMDLSLETNNPNGYPSGTF